MRSTFISSLVLACVSTLVGAIGPACEPGLLYCMDSLLPHNPSWYHDIIYEAAYQAGISSDQIDHSLFRCSDDSNYRAMIKYVKTCPRHQCYNEGEGKDSWCGSGVEEQAYLGC
ncbi:hypothetical protein MVEN_02542400 [Mycena venus]|uniref:Uncharacterized protein n=1 Tax=Mycena venus TaxID=2733690 RepID=A0A8H6WSP1_9AGAR|nr:hypothetical protein MVEN_02542400 [Mycena venus]